MARPRSADKRNAIVAAATAMVASAGLGAPTSKIARAAGVAEGTIFTYFPDKDALLNEVFLDLKHQLRRATLARHTSGALVDRARQFWDRYVNWGVSFRTNRRALRQLAVSEVVTQANKLAGRAMFAEIDEVLEQALTDGGPGGISIDFAGAIMITLAETTIDSIEREPGRRRALTRAGFQAFWNAITGPIRRRSQGEPYAADERSGSARRMRRS
jgi:AcrR family transcriptional regulator